MIKLSIVTPTFNSSGTVLRTIESVYNQNYKNFEHIIIDGKSKDNTLDLIKEYSGYKISYYSEKDDGIYDAMNKGIMKSSGEIVAIINSDDFYADNNVLTDVINLFDKGADIVYGGIAYCNKFGQRTFDWIPSEFHYGGYSNGWHTPHPAFFVRKHLYESKGFFDLNFKIAADFDLMLRLMEDQSINSVRLPRVLVFMQDDGASSKLINIIRGMSDISNSFNKNNIRFNPFKYFLARYVSKLIRKLM